MAEDVGCRDAFQLVALASERSIHMGFTIGVTNPYLRSPEVLATGLVTLAELTNGRSVLGLGSSSPEIITTQLGIEYGRPVRIMRETVQRIRSHVHTLNPAVQPLIAVAAMGPLMLRLAGELADGVLLNTGTTPAYIRWAREEIAVGRRRSTRSDVDFEVAVWLPAYLGPDMDSNMTRARRWAAGMLSLPIQGELLLRHAGLDDSFLNQLRSVYGAYPASGDIDRAAEVVPDHVARTLAVVGGHPDLPARLAPYFEAGADTLVLGPQALSPALPDRRG